MSSSIQEGKQREQTNADQTNDKDPKESDFAYEPGPNSATHGMPETIPAPKSGTAILPPGPWAEIMKKTLFPKAWLGEQLKTHLIEVLREMPPRQELTLRTKKLSWGARALWTKVGFDSTNIEAALIQVVGEVKTGKDRCEHCERGSGPFALCVTVGVEGYPECGNCYWSKQRSRCSFGPRSKGTKVLTRKARVMKESLEKLDAQVTELTGILNSQRESIHAAMEKNPDSLTATEPATADRCAEYYRRVATTLPLEALNRTEGALRLANELDRGIKKMLDSL
ncbi:hypothetical protein N7466_000165 [Penicillium verhagenii]|uniref:uncharacterized protein n=1 Tax=Penicillium verhagenii TaxID=1562060 RepID=UPI002544F4B9|nr:uncharacterized protein N7466_000165 [Penicillium verhagenii]KAJ5947150.1 hypothetical protein N7466_000165 [Penicillium verhagenii]